MRSVRVAVIDDSAAMRGIIAAQLQRDAGIEVVGFAGDPLEGRQLIKALDPDVITLDVEMPNMNGLEFLEKIMRLRPMPVVMVSSLTGPGAQAAIEAQEIGAIDCVAKPSPADPDTFEDLAQRVKAAAASRERLRDRAGRQPAAVSPLAERDYAGSGRIVALGASTGGVEALMTLLARFPANCPATVITQHMPALFTRSFAQRLDKLCAATVEEARDGAPLGPGRIYLAPGGAAHLEVVAGAKDLRCRLREGPPVSGHRPSVDVLFSSVAKASGSNAIGAILTGMGRDGAAGLLAIRQAGGRTLGQNEDTSVVYGMPRAAWEIGAVEKQLPLERIAGEILTLGSARDQPRESSHALR